MHSPEDDERKYQDKIAFARLLVAQFGELRGIFDDNLADSSDEVLPHNFLSDLARFVVSEFMATAGSASVGSDRFQQILDFLESAFESGNEGVQEVIAVSFLELLPNPGQPGGEIRSRLGPKLADELRTIEG